MLDHHMVYLHTHLPLKMHQANVSKRRYFLGVSSKKRGVSPKLDGENNGGNLIF